MAFPIMAALAGAQVVGGLLGANSARKEKKYARRRTAAAEAQAAERLASMDSITQDLAEIRQKDQKRVDETFAPLEADLAKTITEGVDSESKAREAADTFGNQFDASMDAARRAQARQGVRPGSEAGARLEEDAAFNRARGASQEANKARRAADDTDFARKLAFSQQGQSVRQGITNSFQGEFGQQGQIRGQFLGNAGRAQGQADAAGGRITQGFAAATQGAMQGFSDPFGRSNMTSDGRKAFDVANPETKGQTLFDILK